MTTNVDIKYVFMSGKQNKNSIVGTFDASGEVWPYNGMEGMLVCLRGDAGVCVLDQEWSAKAGSGVDPFLKKHDGHMRNSTERAEIASHIEVVSLKPGQSVWIPFGCVHTVSALPETRESKKPQVAADRKKLVKKAPKTI